MPICTSGLILVNALAVAFEPLQLETLLDRPDVWAISTNGFINGTLRPAFVWQSGRQDTAHYPGYANSPSASLLGLKLYEINARFTQGALSAIEASIYNRGDAGELDAVAFDARIEQTSRKLEAWAGAKATPYPPQKLATGMKMDRRSWVKDNRTAVELRYGVSENFRIDDRNRPGPGERVRFRAEYIQVVFSPFDAAHDPRKVPLTTSSPRPSTTTSMDTRQRVTRGADGTVTIHGVPMVDQGQKGYCAVATAERILRYYGTNIDQHVVAQLANASASGGTNPGDMIEALRNLGARFGIRIRTHDEFELRKFLAFVEDYNRVARLRKKPKIELAQQVIDIDAVYRAMDPAVLQETRCERDKAGFKTFTGEVMKYIDAGAPLAWTVILGLVPETPQLPQTSGGHMRIIIGYDKARSEIVYTDSWGAGHERKTMSFEHAWTITTGLYSFEPRR